MKLVHWVPGTEALHGERSWKRFSAIASASAFLSALSVWAFVLIADPYDTGRFALFDSRPLAMVPIRFSIASLGRKPDFNAVIIGNSHVAPLSPERLSNSTGLEFVSLTLPGASVAPEMQVLKWFLLHRTALPKLIVIGVDDVWCRAVPRYADEPPLPLWLISESATEYAGRMFRFEGLEHALRRVFAIEKATARPPDPRGFWDLELDLRWDAEQVAAQLAKPWASSTNLTGNYPALAALADALKGAPDDTSLALVMLPVWANILPQSGSALQSEQACIEAFRAFAGARRAGIFINARTATDLTRDPRNFFDLTHYRAPLAKSLEAKLSQKVRQLQLSHDRS